MSTTTPNAAELAATLERNSLESGGGAGYVLHRAARSAATLLRAQAARIAELEAALAQQVPAVPEGWKLAPVTPTQDMLRTGRVNMDYAGCTVGQLYAAMLAAAPLPAQADNDLR